MFISQYIYYSSLVVVIVVVTLVDVVVAIRTQAQATGQCSGVIRRTRAITLSVTRAESERNVHL